MTEPVAVKYAATNVESSQAISTGIGRFNICTSHADSLRNLQITGLDRVHSEQADYHSKRLIIHRHTLRITPPRLRLRAS